VPVKATVTDYFDPFVFQLVRHCFLLGSFRKVSELDSEDALLPLVAFFVNVSFSGFLNVQHRSLQFSTCQRQQNPNVSILSGNQA
jgi:hypothetical protein